MKKQIKPGYYLAFQTHSLAVDKGRWFKVISHQSHPKDPDGIAFMTEKMANIRDIYYNFSSSNGDKASFGWRVKSVK